VSRTFGGPEMKIPQGIPGALTIFRLDVVRWADGDIIVRRRLSEFSSLSPDSD